VFRTQSFIHHGFSAHQIAAHSVHNIFRCAPFSANAAARTANARAMITKSKHRAAGHFFDLHVAAGHMPLGV
jgi:hypothetical protein